MSNDEIYKDKIYIIFLSTPYMTGRIIRIFTKHLYNHVAISLDDSLNELNSFARYYKSNPLYAGFVKESKLRYRSYSYQTKIKVCMLRVTQEEKNELIKYIDEVEKSEEKYYYNLYSCLGYLIQKKIKIKNSFTCIDFVISAIIKCCNRKGLEEDKFYRIEDLENIYNDDVVYEGAFEISDDFDDWGKDKFIDKHTFFEQINDLATSLYIVTKRYISKK